MDVKTAFLNRYLDEDIYMALPNGFKNNEDTKRVCKLNKYLYGLKQASKCWNERFHTYITKLGFQRSDNDYCLYINSQSDTDENLSYLILYVDNLLLINTYRK
jgi:hypothetical protein